MDILLKIAMGAIASIIFLVGYAIIDYDTKMMCKERSKSYVEHEQAYNSSRDYYVYRTVVLEGHLDLQGDLLAWRNYLANERAELRAELQYLKEHCE